MSMVLLSKNVLVSICGGGGRCYFKCGPGSKGRYTLLGATNSKQTCNDIVFNRCGGHATAWGSGNKVANGHYEFTPDCDRAGQMKCHAECSFPVAIETISGLGDTGYAEACIKAACTDEKYHCSNTLYL